MKMKNNIIDRYAERQKTATLKDKRLVTIGQIIFVLCLLSFYLCPSAHAQNDSVLNRSVTVERDFQPVIQAAGKVSTKPVVVETTIEPTQVVYSDYTSSLTPAPQFNPLLSQPTRFVENEPYHGYVRGGLGHTNTLFDFGYHVDDGKRSILDVYAHHRAQWGLRALSKTTLGLDFTHPFSTCNLYFGLNGGNMYYHKYGHFYDYSLVNPEPSAWEKDKVLYPAPTFTDKDKTSLWSVEAYLGVKANAKQDLQYRVQTGYKLFSKPKAVNEHQLRTHADVDWHSDIHHIGMAFYMQNTFLQLGTLAADIPPTEYNTRHHLHLEPYYAYLGKRFSLHLGVNLDMNIGKGNLLSPATVGNNPETELSFAPSPHINLEAQIAPKWLTLYADIKGSLGIGSLQAFMESQRYRLIHAGIVSRAPAKYVPVDGEVGLHIRPHRDLLVELHGGYAYSMYDLTIIAVTNSATFNRTNTKMQAGDFGYIDSFFGRGKVGGQINYHYQDIVRVNLYGDYYFWKAFENRPAGYTFTTSCAALDSLQAGTNHTVYDRANWQIGLRVDGRIDRHWSLYSDNYFAGSRLALANDGEHVLKPTVQLNLGLQYEMWVGRAAKEMRADGGTNLHPAPQPNLTLFFQLNNWLHRKNDIYYGYKSEGINFLLGATFKF